MAGAAGGHVQREAASAQGVRELPQRAMSVRCLVWGIKLCGLIALEILTL